MIIMNIAALICLILVCKYSSAGESSGECPKKFIYKSGKTCFSAQFDLEKYARAADSCKKLAKGAEIASVRDELILEKVGDFLRDFIGDKVKKSYFWIGMKAEVTGTVEAEMKATVEGEVTGTVKPTNRRWVFDIDGSKVSENYPLWRPQPDNQNHLCAIINGSNDFFVQSIDCGQARLPFVCQKTEAPCGDNNLPYLGYGNDNMCLAVIDAALEYRFVPRACTDIGKPVAIKDMAMKLTVEQAIRNSFIGGGIFLNLQKDGEGVWRYKNGIEPESSDWADGEPREPHTCAALAVQMDGTLKLRSMNCEFLGSYLCAIEMKENGDEEKNDGYDDDNENNDDDESNDDESNDDDDDESDDDDDESNDDGDESNDDDGNDDDSDDDDDNDNDDDDDDNDDDNIGVDGPIIPIGI